MKTKAMKKILSMLLVCVMLVGALAGFNVFATEDPTVEIAAKNVWYGGALYPMFAVKTAAAQGDIEVTITDENGDAVDAYYFRTEVIDGDECYVYISTKGVAAQNINAEYTFTATVGGDEATTTYSILEYLYERLYVDNIINDDEKIAEKNAYEALIAYATAADVYLNAGNNAIDTLCYVNVEGDDANTGIYTKGTNLKLPTTLEAEDGYVVVWTITDSNGSTTKLTVDEMAETGYTVNDTAVVIAATTTTATTTAPITYTAKSFMGVIDDKTPLSAIVLPGTHDSGATKEFKLAGIAVAGTAKCQTLSISEQLAIGVRFFDIRLRRVNGSLQVYHGEVDQELSFDAVLAAFYGFLEENPSEALIVSIKEECDPEGDNAAFDQMVREVLAKARERWYLGSDIPTLGAVRGKCVLMRRFGTSGSYGFDASSGWADNTTFTITRGAYQLEVQDYYQNEVPEGKWDAFAAFCEKMQEKTARSYYLNYSSGNIQNFLGIPSITKVSDHMNPKLLTYLATKPDLVGVFVTDFVTEELAKAIYELNFD